MATATREPSATQCSSGATAGMACVRRGSGVADFTSDPYVVATSCEPVAASSTVTSTSESWSSLVMRCPSPSMRVWVPAASGTKGERTETVGAVPKSPLASTTEAIALSVGVGHDEAADAEHPTRPNPARAVTATRAGSLRTGSV